MTTEEKLELLLASQGIPKLSRPALIKRWSKEDQEEMAKLVDEEGKPATGVVTKFAELRAKADKKKVSKPIAADTKTESTEAERK